MNLIPEGTWRCRGVTAALGYTNSDGEQVGVEIMLLPDQHEDVDGRHVTWYGQFTEKAEIYTLKTLRVLGWQGDDLSDLSGIDANECEAVVAHEQDLQAEWRHRIRFINPLGAGGVAMKNKMTAEQQKAFAERMRGKVLAISKAAPPAPKPAAPAAAAAAARQPKQQRRAAGASAGPAAAAVQPPDDDNIPF